jgi:hypothetical protein
VVRSFRQTFQLVNALSRIRKTSIGHHVTVSQSKVCSCQRSWREAGTAVFPSCAKLRFLQPGHA